MRLGGILFLAGSIGALATGVASAQQAEPAPNPQTFTVNDGVFVNGADLTGSLVIDIANGVVESGDLTVSGIPVVGIQPGNFNNSALDRSIEFTQLNSGGTEDVLDSGNVWFGIDLSDPGLSGPSLELDLLLGSATSLVGYNGGALCISSGNCGSGDFVSGYTLFSQNQADPPLMSGTLVASTATPEPASFLLLAGPIAWIIRRQRRVR